MQYRLSGTGAGVVGLVHAVTTAFRRVQSIHYNMKIKAGKYLMLQKKLYGMASQKLMNFIVIIAIISNTTICEVEIYICPLMLGTVIEKNKEKLQKLQILTW